MQLQAKNIKGFTILEVIVVLCLVGIISAIAYPNIDTWNKTRKVKTEVLRAVNIFENINKLNWSNGYYRRDIGYKVIN